MTIASNPQNGNNNLKLEITKIILMLIIIIIIIIIIISSSSSSTGGNLSNILGGQNKILGQKGIKSDKCMGISQLLGARSRAVPQSLRL